MKSKNFILGEHLGKATDDDRRLNAVGKYIHDAMDEYAKQEAEAFEKWLWNSRYTRKSASFADLWELYLESKKQKV